MGQKSTGTAKFRFWVIADYTMLGSAWDPPIITGEFSSRWRWLAWLKAWWFAKKHVMAHPHGLAVILKRPPPPLEGHTSISLER